MGSSQAKVFDGVGILTVGDAVLIMWKSAARVERNRWLFDRVDAAVAANPGGIFILQLVLQSSSPPDGPARTENEARLKKLGTSLRALVTVPVGDAVWATLVRAIMRALMLVSGRSKVLSVANGIEQGLDLAMSAAGPASPTRKQLVDGLTDLYAALGVTPAQRVA